MTNRNRAQFLAITACFVAVGCPAAEGQRAESSVDFHAKSRRSLEASLARTKTMDRAVALRAVYAVISREFLRKKLPLNEEGEGIRLNEEGVGSITSPEVAFGTGRDVANFSAMASVWRRDIVGVTAIATFPDLKGKIADVQAGKWSAISSIFRLATTSSVFRNEARSYDEVSHWQVKYSELSTTSSVISGYGFSVECKLTNSAGKSKRVVIGAYDQVWGEFRWDEKKSEVELLDSPHPGSTPGELFFLKAVHGG